MDPKHPQHVQHQPYYHLKWGICFMLIAWLFITVAGTFTRIASGSLPISEIVFFRSFIAWLCVVPWVFIHGLRSLKTDHPWLTILRGACGLINTACLFTAIKKTSLVDAMLLLNSAPIFVPFIVWAWLKLPINHKLWPGIIGGLAGVVFILKPGVEIINPGALYALAAGVTLSIVMVSVRLLSYTEKSHAVIFNYFLIASIGPLVFAGSWILPSGMTWLVLIAIGFFTFLGQWAFIRAFHHAKPSQISPFAYSAVVYSAIIEWIVWDHIPDLYVWIGVLLICLGGIWTIRHSTPPPAPVEK